MISYDSWHSYPSVFHLGHKNLADLLLDPVIVEEKIDGSQFSFGLFDDGFRARSKGAQLNIYAPDNMFKKCVEFIQTLDLKPGWTYRAEYLMKPKHNSLAYDRTPVNNIIVFDINTGHEHYLSYDDKRMEAERLGLETVPIIYKGIIEDPQQFRDMLGTISCLGGQKIEGVVIKNYNRFGIDKKVLIGKFVSEEFKEVHAKAWKENNPKQGDILLSLVCEYKTPARWNKAIQHLSEAGLLDGSPRDIGQLIKEIPSDIKKECEEEIKEKLFSWAWPHIRRMVVGGMPEWYKEKLMENQFNSTKGVPHEE